LKHSYTTKKILEVVEFGRIEVFGSDILDSKYLLLGNSHGLFFVDLSKEGYNPVQIIRDLPFNQLAVLEDYSVLIAVSGKHSHIRQYRLSSIRKLIRYLSGIKAERLENLDLSYVADDMEQNDPLDRKDTVDDFYQSMHQIKNHDEAELVRQWRADYVKVVGTRDSKSFVVQRTFSTIFLAALVKQDVIVYQWASEPYSQFLKLKAFWLPEKPKFLKLIHDGINVKQICIGYQNEANLVKIDDSTVKDIETHRAFKEKISVNWKSRWRDFSQIPFSKAKAEEFKNLALNQATVNRKLAAATTLKRPIHHSIEAYFLATFDRVTFVTDASVSPLIGKGVAGWKDGVSWEAPIRQLILRHGEYVVGITNSCIQVNDWNSADCNHKIDFPLDGKMQVLSDRPGGLIIRFEQKRKRPFLYWIKENIPPKMFKKEDIIMIKPVKALSPSQNQLSDPEILKENDTDLSDVKYTPQYTPATYAVVAQEKSPSDNSTSNGLRSPVLGSLDAPNEKHEVSLISKKPASPTASVSSLVSTAPRTSVRRNVPTLSTDEYIRMRNQLASSSQPSQAILTRPIINAYNQPYSQHSYARARPPVTYYGHRIVPGYQPQIETDTYSRRVNPAAPHQMQQVGAPMAPHQMQQVGPPMAPHQMQQVGPPMAPHQMQQVGPPMAGAAPQWTIQKPETPRPFQNENANQPFVPVAGRQFHGPYTPINAALRPPEEYGRIQNSNVMRSNPFSQPVYAQIAPQRQQYSTVPTITLTTPERRQSLSLSESMEEALKSNISSTEISSDEGDGPNK
jgi:hypothetical protein